MVKTFQAYLPSCHRTYSCIHCRAHLANHDELISKSFQGSQGRAYLFNSVIININKIEVNILLYLLIYSLYVLCRHRSIRIHITRNIYDKNGKMIITLRRVNVGCGPAEERVLLTGLHAVADIYCECCKTTLGWKYEHAFESSQKYKEGKFIIELAHMIKENGWE
ncbi:Protein yippee-like 1 [Cyphomyrmex costatus]|uniref:Protein yippee-like n=1 Tax=Cyphomyrmex costatus TaxID=456900 RepID=A0A195CKV1_9HYME|nr:Protein yippee-like 1 [Cyphomyrmex costatus]